MNSSEDGVASVATGHKAGSVNMANKISGAYGAIITLAFGTGNSGTPQSSEPAIWIHALS